MNDSRDSNEEAKAGVVLGEDGQPIAYHKKPSYQPAVEWVVNPLTEQQLLELGEFLAPLDRLVQQYLPVNSGQLGPKEFDAIFSAWQADEASDKLAPSDLVNALGAAFGNHLCKHLDMYWALLTDEHGTCAVVRHMTVARYAYPFDSIWKRIRAKQHQFFYAIEQVTLRGILDDLSAEAG